MKIGISCHPTTGGSGILATELGTSLAERGHEVHFVTYEQPFRLGSFHKNVYAHYVSVISYPLFQQSPASLALANKISEVADENDIQIWHAHYAIPHAASAIIARDMLPDEKKFKIVTTLHGTDITLVGADPSFYRLTKYAMEASDAVTAVSNWLAEETQREFGLSKPPKTIYNFLNFEKFANGEKNCLGLCEEGEKIVMHISNFRPVKRVTDVVRVFKKISEQVPSRLVMVGDGPERLSAVGVAKQLGLSSRIKYLGNHDDVASLISCADLVFQPSEHESFGLVPLEAMACGVPVLGTASGGICEVVEHDVTGYLCEVGDTETMAKLAVGILTNEELALKMGEAGKERARTLFDREKIVKQYEQLYEELIANIR